MVLADRNKIGALDSDRADVAPGQLHIVSTARTSEFASTESRSPALERSDREQSHPEEESLTPLQSPIPIDLLKRRRIAAARSVHPSTQSEIDGCNSESFDDGFDDSFDEIPMRNFDEDVDPKDRAEAVNSPMVAFRRDTRPRTPGKLTRIK